MQSGFTANTGFFSVNNCQHLNVIKSFPDASFYYLVVNLAEKTYVFLDRTDACSSEVWGN